MYDIYILQDIVSHNEHAHFVCLNYYVMIHIFIITIIKSVIT